jgi:hypothetical protein
MPRKKDTSSVQLRKHIDMGSNRLAHALGLVSDSELLGSAYEAMRKYAGSDWNNVDVRSIAAHHALAVNERDVPLKKAFAAFGFDDKDPFHWRKMLFYFANVHFGTNQPQPGRPRVWSDGQLCALLRDFNWRKSNYQSVSGSSVSEVRICELLKSTTKFKGRYSKFNTRTILRNLQRARDPKKNRILGKIISDMAEPLIAKLRVGFQKKGANLDSKWETQIRSASLAMAIKALSAQGSEMRNANKDGLNLIELRLPLPR